MKEKKVMKKSKYGQYYTIPFTRNRDIVVDFISMGKKTMKVYAIGEIDVTLPLKKIAEYKEEGTKISFTGYIAYVLIQTIIDHPHMQAIKWRKRKMVVFEDVDLFSVVEKEVKGQKVPSQVIIRKANEKSILEITYALWSQKKRKDDSMADKEDDSGTDLLLKMPGFLRRFLMNRIFKNPFLRRQFLGTVGVTSVGMYTKGGGTSIPIAVENLSINIGGIDKKPGYEIKDDGTLNLNRIVPREYLWLTFNIDHTTVDGAPTARFIADFRERLKIAYGLDNMLD